MLKGTQAKIYEFLVGHIRLRGYPPSVREIGKAIGLQSSSTVHGHLERLERRGYIRRDPSKTRAIELTLSGNAADEALDIKSVPLIGKVLDGVPIETNKCIEAYLPIPSTMDGNFFFTVKGDYMHDVGIHNGDYVLVRNQSVAESGDIVVVKTHDGEVMVRKFILDNDSVQLQPCNSKNEASFFDSSSIVGKVIALYRFSDAHEVIS